MITLYKKILVPVDGTAASEEVIRFVCSLQQLMQAEIHIVFVAEVPRSLPLNECPPDKLNEARNAIKSSEGIASDYSAIVQTRIIYARTTEDSILITAQELGCDMIAIAQNNQKSRFFANTALNIYQRAKCSVWLVNIRQGRA